VRDAQWKVLPADLSHFLTYKHLFSATNDGSSIYNSRMEKNSEVEKIPF
jgi:hypothetical protein